MLRKRTIVVKSLTSSEWKQSIFGEVVYLFRQLSEVKIERHCRLNDAREQYREFSSKSGCKKKNLRARKTDFICAGKVFSSEVLKHILSCR